MNELTRYRTELGVLAAGARRMLSPAGYQRLCQMQRELWLHQRWHPAQRGFMAVHYAELRGLLRRELDGHPHRRQAQRLLRLCRRCCRK